MHTSIDNIIFDLGGVLVDLQPEVSLAHFRTLGITDIDQMLNPYRQQGVFHDLEMGLLDRASFTQALNEHAGTALTDEKINEAIMLFLAQVPLYKYDYLERLRPHKRLYILSNTNPYIMDYAHSQAFLPERGRTLSDYVDKIYASCWMHAMKPDREIYEQMLQDSGMNPARSLFIDDSVANIAAAQEVGLHTLLVHNGCDWRPLIEERIPDLRGLLEGEMR